MTTAGERSERGYRPDDPPHPWSSAANPDRGAGYRDAGYSDAGYPDRQAPEVGYWNAGREDRAYRGNGYRDDHRNGYRDGYQARDTSAAPPGREGHPAHHESYPAGHNGRDGYRAAPEYWDEFRDAGHGGQPAGHAPPGYRRVDDPTSELSRIRDPDLVGRFDRAGGPGPPGPPGPVSRGGRRRAADQPTAPERGQPRRPDQDRRRRLKWWQELPLLLVIAFCLAILIRTFLLQAFYIPSGSMEDTLLAGDRVLANKVVYHFREPQRGEVVVFQGTDAWAPLGGPDPDGGALARIGRAFGDLVGVSQPGEKDYIKRIIGLPGDVVSCCDVEGRLFVNGEPINESYVIRDSPLNDTTDGVRDCRGRQFDEVVVEPGMMFVMGDHRQRSQDSRCQGQVPIDNIIGRAFVIVWPTERWASLSAPPEIFANIPGPVAAGAPPAPTGAGEVGLVLPLLLPVGASFRRRAARPARTRTHRRGRGRRLTA